MILVVDASAAFATFGAGTYDTAIRNATDLIAPDLIVPETLNACWKMQRSGAIVPTLDAVFRFIDRVRIVSSGVVAREAADLAERLDHPVYDMIYVALAQHERAKLLTADSRLLRKLRAHRLQHLIA